MVGDWTEHRIADLGRIVTGKTPPTSEAVNYGGIVPFVTPTDMDGRRIISQTQRYLSPHGVEAVQPSLVPANAILVSCIGSEMGKTALIERQSVTNQQINSIIPNEGVDRLFVYYNLSIRKDEIRSLAGGAAQPILNKGDFGRLPIRVPSLSEQRRISSVLSAFDDKIELNRRMAETLEAMARALFRSWFVDFDPVHARAEGRPTGLPNDLAALFPDSFNGDGIPSGWYIGKVSEFAPLNPASWTESSRPNNINYVDLANAKWGRIEAVQRFTKEMAPSRAKRILYPGDTIIGVVRPGNGSYALVTEPGLTGSTGFAVLHPISPKREAIVFLAATHSGNIETLARLADGAAYPAVRPDVVAASPIVVADEQVLDAFDGMASRLLCSIALRAHQSRTLAALRDTLLPKLISGELRTADAERHIEAA